MNTATVDKKEFVKRLATVARITSTKSILPILYNVYIGIVPRAVLLRSTDLEIGELSVIAATTEGEGCAVTIPASMMLKLLRKAPKSADTITLSVDEKDVALDVTVGTLSLHLKGIDAEEFPCWPIMEADIVLSIAPDELMSALQQVLPATAQDEDRPILMGVNFSMSDGILTLAAADGYRLAVRELAVDYTGEPFKVIVPGRMLAEIARELKGQTEIVKISISEDWIKAETETLTVIAAPVSGYFPDYKVIIPAECATHVKFLAENLLEALSVVEPISNENAHIVRLSVNGSLTVTATSSEMGTASQSMGAKMEGEGGEIAFNVRYLKEAIKCIDSEVVSMGMNTWEMPGIFRPVGNDNYLHVLMPMKLE